MVAVNSTMMELASSAPDFSLPDVCSDDRLVSLSDFQGQVLLVMFICNHCPFVIRIVEGMTSLANQFLDQGIAAVAISSNDVLNYPQDGPEPMRDFAAQNGFEFPYLYDESQEIAKAYGAACTPDFYLFDRSHQLCYRGQMDGARPGNDIEANGVDLRLAMQAVLEGNEINLDQKPSIGCNIKWRAGNEPYYF